MEQFDLENLGAREISPGVVEFGVLFPEIGKEYELWVKIIHEEDQFL